MSDGLTPEGPQNNLRPQPRGNASQISGFLGHFDSLATGHPVLRLKPLILIFTWRLYRLFGRRSGRISKFIASESSASRFGMFPGDMVRRWEG